MWKNPRPNDFSPEALRAIFKSIEDFLKDPTFANGVAIGDGTMPSYDGSTGVTTPAATTDVDADTFAGIDTDLTQLQTDLDAAEADIAAAEADITTLNTTTIPALDTRLDDAEAAVAAAQADVDAILPIETADISPLAITAPLLAANSVVAGKIAAGTIVAADIAADTITANEIAGDTITANEIAADAITTNELAADSVTAAELAAINIAVGKWIASTSYVAGTSGWIVEADGSAEFNDVTVRGDITASEFHGADVTNEMSDPSFESGLDGFSNNALTSATGTCVQSTTQARTGTHSMRVGNTGTAATQSSKRVSCAPGDIIYASGWVRKTSFIATPGLEYQNEIVLNIDFLEAGSYVNFNNARTVARSGQWVFLECYAAAPTSFDAIDQAEISFKHSATPTNFLYVDDVVIGQAPLLEVPYIVTNEDDGHQRARMLPNHIGFDGVGIYPYGLRSDEYGDGAVLRVDGPFDTVGANPYIELENDPGGAFADSVVRIVGAAVELNGYDIAGASTSYTPSNTAVTVGNGTQTASYIRIGNLVYVSYDLQFGSTTTFTGTPFIGVPFTAAGAGAFQGEYRQFGTRSFVIVAALAAGQSAVVVNHTESGNQGRVNATNPFTVPASGSNLRFSGWYIV